MGQLYVSVAKIYRMTKSASRSLYKASHYLDDSPASSIILHIAVDIEGIQTTRVDGVHSTGGESLIKQLLTRGN